MKSFFVKNIFKVKKFPISHFYYIGVVWGLWEAPISWDIEKHKQNHDDFLRFYVDLANGCDYGVESIWKDGKIVEIKYHFNPKRKKV